MKKNLIVSYVSGILDTENGERYDRILRLFFPEFVIALLVYSLPLWVDAYFISCLKSTPTYGTLGVTNNLLHFVMKVAEGISVGTVILSGFYNGKQEFENVGRALRDAFWLTIIAGASIATFLYLGAAWIYSWYVPEEMVAIGVPFLRLRAIGIFFMYVCYSFMGFLRGIKNTRVPMQIYIVGVMAFLIADYILIFGHCGSPALGLTGSAIASVIQYVVMTMYAATYVLTNKEYHMYGINLMSSIFDHAQLKRLLQLSWPVVLDKATLAAAYIWLAAMFKKLGVYAVATFCVVKDMERLAFLPAIACAQVITLLVSNDYGQQNWKGIKSNIKKIAFLASSMVFAILIILVSFPEQVIGLFDHQREFTPLAAAVFPFLSILVFCDLVQLVLSGALRGAANVRMVMLTRLIVCGGYFVPISYVFSILPIESVALKFILIYGSFYFGNALMSIVYIYRLRSEEWKKKATT